MPILSSESTQLFALLSLIYLGECIRWVRRGGVAFEGWPRIRASRRSSLLHNDRGDAFLGWPLPPFGSFIVARGLPFSASPEGVLTFIPASLHADGRPNQPVHLLRWTDFSHLQVAGEKLLVGGRPVWHADSPTEALHLARLLQQLARTPDQQRAAECTRLARHAFDEAAIRERLASDAPPLDRIRKAAITLWCLLFLLIPATVWYDGWSRPLWIGLPLVFGITAWIGIQTTRLHRQWHPGADDERFRLGLLTGLSPVTAIRATDLLSRSRYHEFHPAALGLVLLDRNQAEELASALWRDLRHPRQPLPIGSPEANAIEAGWRTQCIEAFHSFALRNGMDPASWEAPPGPTDPAHRRYCPRCRTQTTEQAESCTDCGGIPLLPIDPEGAATIKSSG